MIKFLWEGRVCCSLSYLLRARTKQEQDWFDLQNKSTTDNVSFLSSVGWFCFVLFWYVLFCFTGVWATHVQVYKKIQNSEYHHNPKHTSLWHIRGGLFVSLFFLVFKRLNFSWKLHLCTKCLFQKIQPFGWAEEDHIRLQQKIGIFSFLINALIIFGG